VKALRKPGHHILLAGECGVVSMSTFAGTCYADTPSASTVQHTEAAASQVKAEATCLDDGGTITGLTGLALAWDTQHGNPGASSSRSSARYAEIPYGNENALEQAVASIGPVAVAVDANPR